MRIDSRKLEKMSEWMEKREDIPKGWIYLGDDIECYFIGQPGKRNILVFLANPGTSNPGDNNIDSTMKKVKKLATEDMYDGWIMAYLYPLRTKDSKKLPEKEDKKLLEKNLKVLMALVKSYKIDAVWASWGNTIDTRFYLGDNLYDIQEKLECDCEWYYRRTMTRDGNPRHPSYIKSGDEYKWFPVCDYAVIGDMRMSISDNVRIRKANKSDLDAVVNIYDEIHKTEEEGIISVGWIRGIYPVKETAEEALKREDLFIIEKDGIVLGSGIINKIQVDVYKKTKWGHEAEDDKVCVLHTLAISPMAGKQGLGKEFIKFYENYALENGCSEVRIDTNERNMAARKMYSKLGYKEVAIVPTVFNGIPDVNLVLLEKYLGQNA